MGTVMDNLQALPSGVPVPGNAGSSRWSSSPHLPGPGGLISRQLCTRRAGIHQNRKKKKGIGSRKDFSQVPVRPRVVFVGRNTQVCVEETCRASLQGLTQLWLSLGCVDLALSWRLCWQWGPCPALQGFPRQSTNPRLDPLPFAHEEGLHTPSMSIFPAQPLGTDAKGFQG